MQIMATVWSLGAWELESSMNSNNKGLTTSVRLGSLSCSRKKTKMPKKLTQAKCISTILDDISLDYYFAHVHHLILIFKNIQICRFHASVNGRKLKTVENYLHCRKYWFYPNRLNQELNITKLPEMKYKWVKKWLLVDISKKSNRTFFSAIWHQSQVNEQLKTSQINILLSCKIPIQFTKWFAGRMPFVVYFLCTKKDSLQHNYRNYSRQIFWSHNKDKRNLVKISPHQNV